MPNELGEAPAYSKGLEFAVAMFLRGMDPENKLVLARRMVQVFSHLEREALDELGLEREG
jgi:hypothetical protein